MSTFKIKITQLRLERNYDEAVRLLQARLTQFHYASEYDKANNQVELAFMQRLAGDMAGAKAIAEQARDTLEHLHRDQPDNEDFAASLSQTYAVMEQKDSAINAAERAIMLYPRANAPMDGPALEENMALIQTIFGENSRAISTLTQLLQTPYGAGVTPQRPLRGRFLGWTQSGTLCVLIALPKTLRGKARQTHRSSPV